MRLAPALPLLVAATLASDAALLRAQTRPLLTEQATTARAGTLVLETGLDAIANEPSYVTDVERTAWSGPLLRLVYSPADSVELDLEWVARVGVLGEQGRGDLASSDWGDLTLRAKWRFAKGRTGRPALAARFGVILPETSFEDRRFRPAGLGPNTLRAFVDGLASRRLGPLLVHLNAGLFLADEVYRPHDQRDLVSYGIALEWPLTPKLSVLAECAGRAGDGRPGTDARSEARAGIRFGRGRARGDVALRRGLAAADGTWGATVGLSWTIRDGRP